MKYLQRHEVFESGEGSSMNMFYVITMKKPKGIKQM